ncbi:WecB/TagA/CpsF family glycosyltransferase [Allorhizobium sp. NPDC080224]|uniref:WecB/TagA/CpsF family glycosyltransferase n=1 Tax=Allorhizobium sp. NPDC080224 TaxID=3390547 RepID=UPI003CFEBD3F
MDVPYDFLTFHEVVDCIEAERRSGQFRYVVTPNVDHVVRMRGNLRLKEIYKASWLSLCDSKPIYWVARLLGIRMTLVTGSDLTSHLFHERIRPHDKVVLIAPYAEVGSRMAERFPEIDFRCHVPPQGLISKPEAMEACVRFVTESETDFVFIAVGSPQSELLAHEISKSKQASGICICCGASLEFITDLQTRAPALMQRLGLEWLYRLLSDPKRLWRRYVYSVPPLAWLCLKEIMKRSGVIASKTTPLRAG